MVKMNSSALITFVNSDIYNDGLKVIVERAEIKIAPDYCEVIQGFDMKSLNKGNVTIEYCKELLENDFDTIINFCVEKLKKYDDEEDDGGEFPEGEGLGEDEKPTLIASDGYAKGFLLMYIVEYHFLKNNPKGLLNYIKGNRIPFAKKYEQELKQIYKKILLINN
jgi:hypothetical protein